MGKKPFEGPSADKQDTSIWAVSQNYIRGDIDVDTFERAEYPDSQNFRQANLAPTHKKYLSITTIGYISISCIFIVIFLILYIYTKNQLFIICPSIISYPFILIGEKYLSKKDR